MSSPIPVQEPHQCDNIVKPGPGEVLKPSGITLTSGICFLIKKGLRELCGLPEDIDSRCSL